MSKLITIQEAAAFLGVSSQTLRRWEREGRGVPFQKTAGVQRRYDLAKLHCQDVSLLEKKQLTLAYARVSSHDQKKRFTETGKNVRNILRIAWMVF